MKPNDIVRLVLLAMIWSSSFLFLKIAAPFLGIPLTIGARLIIAALILMVGLLIRNCGPDFRKNWKAYLLLGAFNMAIPFALVTLSILYLNSSIGAILNATTPLFTMILASVWLKEKMTTRKLTGLVTGIAGVAILVGWIPVELTKETVMAIAASLLAALSYGIGNVYAKKRFAGAHPGQTAAGQLAGASLLVLPFMLQEASIPQVSLKVFFAIAMLAVVCTALAYGLYFRLTKNVGSVNASTVTLLVPAFTLLWSTLFLDEPVTAGLVVGMLVLLSGIRLVVGR